MYHRQYLKAGSAFKITCSHPIIVLVMTDSNLHLYNSGGGVNYYGGFFAHFPAIVEVPIDGYWNILLETREFSLRTLQYSIDVMSEKDAAKITVD